MCSHVNYVREDAVCIREFFELSAHKLFSLVGNDQHGRTKILIHRSAMHFATVPAVLSRIGMHNWYNVPQDTVLQKTILESSGDSITKRSTPSVSLKRRVRGSAAGNPGFGGCPLAAHAGHSNSRRTSSRTSGRARLRREPSRFPPCSGAHNCHGYFD